MFTSEDVQIIYELNKSPEVTRYTHDPVDSLGKAREVLEQGMHFIGEELIDGHFAQTFKPVHPLIPDLAL